MKIKEPKKFPLYKLAFTRGNILKKLRAVSRYGDVVQIPHVSRKALLITQLDIVSHMLHTEVENYTKEKTIYTGKLGTALGKGVLTNSGEAWRKMRQLTAPLLSPKNLAKHAEYIVAETQKTLDKWEKKLNGKSKSKNINLGPEIFQLALVTSIHMFFGVDVRSSAKRIIKTIHICNRSVTSSIPLWLPTSLHQKFYLAHIYINYFLKKVIQKAKNKTFDTPPLLWPLLSEHNIDEKELVEETKNFFIPGHETTGNAIIWTLYCLSQFPEKKRKLQDEIETVLQGRTPVFEDLNNLPYLEMALLEAMRMFPPIWSFERTVLEDQTVGGYFIPKDSLLIVSPYLLHRHPEYWPEPDEYIPERFDKNNEKKHPKNAYLAFGTGPRVCIGKHMAMMSAKLILACILQRFDFEPAPDKKVTIEPLITLRAGEGLWLKLAAR